MNYKKKGFTLIEMIIVIAIIAVLSAILIPSWMNYIAKSRLKTQNGNARVIFNAAQTVAQEYKFSEKKLKDAEKMLGSASEFYYYWDGNNGSIVDADGNERIVSANDDGTKTKMQTSFENNFARKLNKIFSDSEETVYKIYVKDYLVQSVVSARTEADRYLGRYPDDLKESSSLRIMDAEYFEHVEEESEET